MKNIEEEFNKRFCRVSRATGEYMDRWFLKDYITAAEVKAFLLQALTDQKKEIRDWVKKNEIGLLNVIAVDSIHFLEFLDKL
jgi:hypothetical protein